ncbi:MAG: cation transporter [Dehalococcoidia bacterium]|nr:cation transporter [Dehalococcoidia bacterium]
MAIEKIQLDAENNSIHCEICERFVQGAVRPIPGVLDVKADHKTQLIHITLDNEKKPLIQILTTLEFMGYPTIQGQPYRGME